MPQPGRWWVVPWQITSLRSLLAWCSQLLNDRRNINARATHSHSFALLLNIFLNFPPELEAASLNFCFCGLCFVLPSLQEPRHYGSSLRFQLRTGAGSGCQFTHQSYTSPRLILVLSLPLLCTSPIHDPHLPSPTSSSFRCFGLKSGPRANTALDGTSSAIPSCSACVNEK